MATEDTNTGSTPLDIIKHRQALNHALNAASAFQLPNGPTKILDFLFLGSRSEAQDLHFIRFSNITHVINCAADYVTTGPSFYGDDVKYLGFKAEDSDDYDMMQHFQEAWDFIEDARKTDGRVLVHCVMGINRSGLMTTAYVMKFKQISPIRAAIKIKQKHGCILVNEGFQTQLIKYALENGYLRNTDTSENSEDQEELVL